LTETFNDNTVNQTYLSVASTAGVAQNFQWEDQLDSSPLKVTTWSFAIPMVGFGGDFDLSPLGPGGGISMDAYFVSSGWLNALTIPNSAVDAFYGFIADEGFTQVRFTSASGGQETYEIDDLSYAWVPEPSTFLLLGTGLLGLVARRRQTGDGGLFLYRACLGAARAGARSERVPQAELNVALA